MNDFQICFLSLLQDFILYLPVHKEDNSNHSQYGYFLQS